MRMLKGRNVEKAVVCALIGHCHVERKTEKKYAMETPFHFKSIQSDMRH